MHNIDLKLLALALCFIASVNVRAESSWLNIQGNADDPTVDTIEVDPVPMVVSSETRNLRVRVSRAEQRTDWDGIRYRSYNAEVQFDCARNTARYVAMEYFMQPVWKGTPHSVTRYVASEPRAMRFRDVKPNPTAKIMRAVCASSAVAPAIN